MTKKVLVVDDDPDIRELIAFKLRQQDFEVHLAADGEEALVVLRDEQPQLALLDVMMPKRSGLEVLQALRDDPETQSLPVIMLTAKAQEADVERGFDLGADDYIVKPFSPRELMSRVRAVMTRGNA
jgi:DNA-binding response OmpR family regulator